MVTRERADEEEVDQVVATNYASKGTNSAFCKSKLTTLAYCMVFWSFGICVAFLGPTQASLICKYRSDTATMSWLFFVQSLFVLVGSVLGGKIICKASTNAILLVSTTVMAVTMALIAVCATWAWLSLVLALMGLCMGCIDTATNLAIIDLYGKSVGPFLHTLHFFYGLGAFLSPLIVEGYLVLEECSNATSGNSSQPLEPIKGPSHLHEDRIDTVFLLMSLLQLPVVLLVAIQFFKQISNKEEEKERLPEEINSLPASAWQSIVLVILTASLLFIYDGLQETYGGYILIYSTKSIANISSTAAAQNNAYFWGTFTLGRLVCIFIATKVSASKMLIANILGCITSMLIMLWWNEDSSALFVGTCLFGAFLSSVYPSAIALTEQLIRITPGLMSVIVIGASSGEMLLPVIVGHLMDESPISFLIIGFVLTQISLCIFIIILSVACLILKSNSFCQHLRKL